jgi:hypothetical protein
VYHELNTSSLRDALSRPRNNCVESQGKKEN